MKTIKKVSVVPIEVKFIPHPSDMKEGEIYVSAEYKASCHLCLCGCKNLTVTPLTKNQWVLFINDGKITMTPSIGNFQFDCKSHYIITNGIANFV